MSISRTQASSDPTARHCAVIVLLTLLCTGCNSSQIENTQRDTSAGDVPRVHVSESEDIAFHDGMLEIRGATLAFPAGVESLVAIIGQPGRTMDKVNIIYVWDELGIVAYRNPDADILHSFSVQFENQGFDFSPRANFTGRIILAGGVVASDASRHDLRSAGLAPDAELPFLYVAREGQYAIIAEVSDSIQTLSIDWSD